MSGSRKTIRIENFGHLRKLTISNPKRKNALSSEAYAELSGKHWDQNISKQNFQKWNLPANIPLRTWKIQRVINVFFCFENVIEGALNEAAVDDTVTIVAITGDGDYYSSGNDISNFLKVSDPQEALHSSRVVLKALIESFYNFPKLLICVVNGPCIGIAATTAALADIVYATDTVYYCTKCNSNRL